MPSILFRRWLLAALARGGRSDDMQPAAAAPSKSCVSAKISAPFWLPDGELHAPGNLTLCIVRSSRPIANLHKLSVDGRTVGVFLSQKRVAEGTGGGAPEVIFERDAAGNLKLLGYSVPERDRVLAFRLPAATPARGAPALARVP